MKLAFSTLGCPFWKWEEILSAAKDLGIGGIEVRGVFNELYAPNIQQFSPQNIQVTRERLKKLGLEICILTSSTVLTDNCDFAETTTEVEEYIMLAEKLGTKLVRVLADRNPEPSCVINEEYVHEKLKYLAAFAEKHGVCIVVESNGIYGDTAKLAELVESTGSSNVGVLWDIHHPFRYYGETIEQSYGNIKKYLKHVHVKDSVMSGDKVTYKMPGFGDVPILAAAKLLEQNGYDGYISLEWVKRWNEELEDPGVVLPIFADHMRSGSK